jgi:hypothetical protein
MGKNQAEKLNDADFALGSHWFSKLPVVAGLVGVVGLAATFGLGASAKEQMFFSYHVAFMYFLSIALGAFFFVIVQFATKAGWSVLVRRIAENLAGTLPVFVLLAIPLILGSHTLFHHWMDAEVRETDRFIIHKAPYLNEPFFYGRMAFYLLVWAVLSYLFRSRSVAQDASGDQGITRRLQNLSYPSIFLFAITITFASVDWIMSMDPHWYSTMFGVYYFAGAIVAIYATLVLLSMALQSHKAFGHIFNVEHFHDLGKLMFGHTAFWAYIAFSQFFLIWYANIPEETLYFKHRAADTWLWVSIALGVGHFCIPFVFLISARMKRNRGVLWLGALWMLVIHFVDIHWLIMPTLHTKAVSLSILDVTAFLGVGGIFLATFGILMKRARIVPTRDPRLPESLAFENII